MREASLYPSKCTRTSRASLEGGAPIRRRRRCGDKSAGAGDNTHLSKSGYHTRSALVGAVLAYNCEDLQLLIMAVRARDPATMEVVTDEDVVRRYISWDQLQHHVRLFYVT